MTLQRPDRQNLPLTFEANQGQADPKVKFISRAAGFSLLLTDGEAVMLLNDSPESDLGLSNSPKIGSKGEAESSQSQFRHLESSLLKMKVVGGNASSRIEGVDALNGTSNYIIGNDRKKWRSNIINYAKAQQKDIYRGIDLVYHGSREQMEYDFIVAPEARPDCITLEFEGARELRIDASGDLVLETARGSVHQKKPFIYQEEGGQIKEIAGRYQIKGRHRVGFQVSAYDKTKTLVIDPEIVYSTYLGNTRNVGYVQRDMIFAVALDSARNTYVTGQTDSFDFPVTADAFQSGNASNGSGSKAFDSFFSKFDSAGRLVYSTYMGGKDFDEVYSIAVDASDNVYLAGYTLSSNFPTTPGAFSTKCTCESNRPADNFVMKFSSAGSLIYSTFLGTTDSGQQGGIAADAAGNAYAVGSCRSGLGVNGVPITELGAGYLAKLNATGTALLYSTSIGDGQAKAIAIDAAGNAYITGMTYSFNFPVKNSLWSNKRGGFFSGIPDMFVLKIDTTKSGADSLLYSTYIPASGGYGIALGASGSVYISGTAHPNDFPKKNILKDARWSDEISKLPYPDSQRNFIAKLNLSRTGQDGVDYVTFYGGAYAVGLALDGAENVYTTGQSLNKNLPVINATSGGGVFVRSSDGGNSFDTLDQGIVTPNVLHCIAVDPKTPATMYTAGGAALLKTTNGGLNWKELKSDPRMPAYLANVLAVDPQTPSTIYAGVDASPIDYTEQELANVYKSTDSGATWKVTGLNQYRHMSVRALALDPNNPAIIYAGARMDLGTGSTLQKVAGVFKSTNGGATWNQMSNGLNNIDVNALAIDPKKTSTIYAGTALGLFKTADSGNSWTSAGFEDQVIALAIDPQTPSNVYATLAEPNFIPTFVDGGRGNPRKRLHSNALSPQLEGIIKTTDGGQTWKDINLGFGQFVPLAYDIKIDPRNPNALYVGTDFGIYTSINAGQSWSFNGRIYDQVKALAVHPRTPSVVYAVTTVTTKVYIGKVSADGSKLMYSGFLGGNNNDWGNGIAIDSAGNIYVAGITTSPNFPTTANAFQSELRGYLSSFVAKISGLDNLPEPKEPAQIPDTSIKPRITSVSVSGKKLFVFGDDFSREAIIIVNGVEQKTSNDSESPTAKLMSKKAGKKMKAAQETVIQVKNSDGTLSDEYRFIR